MKWEPVENTARDIWHALRHTAKMACRTSKRLTVRAKAVWLRLVSSARHAVLRLLRSLQSGAVCARHLAHSAANRFAAAKSQDAKDAAPDSGEALPRLRLGRLRSATTKIKHTFVSGTYGKGTYIARCFVTAAAILMGFAVLLICVYTLIPSMISDAAHLFEHDIAVQMYKRTLKGTDMAAFSQPLVVKDVLFPRDCFASALKENPDVVGRLSISGLGLGYLVTQSADNDYYASADYTRKKSTSGTLYLDCRCNAVLTPPQGHYIIYGNNVNGGTMFGKLDHFLDKDFFSANRTLRFDTLYADYEWEVFSAYIAKPDFYFTNTSITKEDEWLAFLQQLLKQSAVETDTQLAKNDVLMTLCTDYGNGTRLAVHARLR